MIAGVGTIIIFMMLVFSAILFFTAKIITRYRLWKKVFYGIIVLILLVIIGSILKNKFQMHNIEQLKIENSSKFPEPNIEKDFNEVINAANKKMKEINVEALKMIGKKSYSNRTNTTKYKLKADEYFFINSKNEFVITKRIGDQETRAGTLATMPMRNNFINYVVFYTYKGYIGREVTIWDKVLMAKDSRGKIVRDLSYINKDSKPWYEAEGLQKDLYFDTLVNCPISLIAGCEEIHYTKFKEEVNQKKFSKNYNERIIYRENLDACTHPIAMAYKASKDKSTFFYQEEYATNFEEGGSNKDSIGNAILSLEN